MRNELQIALTNHIKKRCDQYGDNLQKLRDLYSEFDNAENEQITALNTLSDLLFEYAICQDGSEENIFSPSQIFGICYLMQNSLDIIQASINAKENLERPILELLKQGAE